jgi:hypothetical protein
VLRFFFLFIFFLKAMLEQHTTGILISWTIRKERQSEVVIRQVLVPVGKSNEPWRIRTSDPLDLLVALPVG